MKTLLILLIVLPGCITLKAQSAEEILARHRLATGGENNWNAVRSMRFTGIMNDRGVEVAVVISVRAGNAMCYETTLNGFHNRQAFSINDGWAGFLWNGTGRVDTVSLEKARFFWPEMEMGNNLLLGFMDHHVVSAGIDVADEKTCYKLTCKRNNEHEIIAYLDTATYLLVRLETILNVNEDDRDYYISFSDYISKNGVMVPRSVYTTNGRYTYSKIEFNTALDEALFVPAPADKAK